MEKSYYQNYLANQWLLFATLPSIVNMFCGKMRIVFIIITIINACILTLLRKKWKKEQTKNSQLLYICVAGMMLSFLLFVSWIRICSYIKEPIWIRGGSAIIYFAVIVITVFIGMTLSIEKRKISFKIWGSIEIFATGGSIIGVSFAKGMGKNVSQNQAYFVIALCLYIISLIMVVSFMAFTNMIKEYKFKMKME